MDTVAVIFDMDGVLVDTYQPHFLSWRQLADERSLPFSDAAFRNTFGKTGRTTIAELWGVDRFDDAQIAEMLRYKEIAFRQLIERDFPTMPGIELLLERLHQANIPCAVGSSGPAENVAFVVDRLGGNRHFSAVVSGSDVTRGKPDPQIFLLAAERMTMPPSRCVVVEDAPVGVAAARAAGMKCIGLLSTGRCRQDLQTADAIVESHDEITPPMVRTLLSPAQLMTESAAHKSRQTRLK